jgi:hypothetical protein
LAAGLCGFWVVDVGGDVSSPTWLAAIDTPGFALDVEVVEEELLLFVADHNGGLEIYDVEDPADPRELGFVGRANPSFGAAIDVDVLDGLAYVATTQGLRVVDAADPEDPRLIGVFDTPAGSGPGQDVEVVRVEYETGDEIHAYLSAFQEGVFILDVSDPTLPEQIAWIPSRTPGVTAVYEVTVAGTVAFLGEDSPELRMFDVSDPTDPRELDPYPSLGHVWDIVVKDAVAYLALGEDPFGATPGVEAVHVTLMGLAPEDVAPIPEPSSGPLAVTALATVLWLRSRRRRTARGGTGGERR